MRNEQEMMDLIVGVAQRDERIRTVIMNGSRANPKAPRDFFQDYDIVYLVREVAPFVANQQWIDVFGERMIMQMPKRSTLLPDEDDSSFVYLMQFMDGNRIDLSLIPVEKGEALVRESQSILLLDKDNIVPPFPPASDADFIIKPPTESQFNDCCNEFWWIGPYVAKGIWRRELPYALHMYDRYLRDMLDEMLKWHIGIKTGFRVSTGKCGKYFERYLEPELWEKVLQTYSDGDYEHLWEALFVAGDLFRSIGHNVAKHFGFQYPVEDDRRVTAHLLHVRELSQDAAEMYE